MHLHTKAYLKSIKIYKKINNIKNASYNTNMYELYPYFTNDGSVGLFSPDADDIYHSTYGALTEAYEKFILPADFEKYFSNHNKIKILDICFGIGYNTKSFLNYFYEKIFCKNDIAKNNYIETIDTNNNTYNATLDTDNKNSKNLDHEHLDSEKLSTENDNSNLKPEIYIKAIDTDKTLAFLSPFIVTGKRFWRREKIKFQQEKIEKMLKKNSAPKIWINDEINIILLLKIIENHPEILEDTEITRLLASSKYSRYFSGYMRRYFAFKKTKICKYTPLKLLSAYLHNIYYRYISKRQKKALNALKLLDFNFDLKIDDARKVLLTDNNIYNFVFLDAFTPAKCPCLWTVDFLRLLYSHLDVDGMILTYSNAANIRSAFLEAGFYVGKIYNAQAGKFTGTIAVKNKSLIKNELSEYDLGLLKTKAGIFYRDENLTGLNEAIVAAHKKEVETSTRISSSKFIKQWKKNIVVKTIGR